MGLGWGALAGPNCWDPSGLGPGLKDPALKHFLHPTPLLAAQCHLHPCCWSHCISLPVSSLSLPSPEGSLEKTKSFSCLKPPVAPVCSQEKTQLFGLVPEVFIIQPLSPAASPVTCSFLKAPNAFRLPASCCSFNLGSIHTCRLHLLKLQLYPSAQQTPVIKKNLASGHRLPLFPHL